MESPPDLELLFRQAEYARSLDQGGRVIPAAAADALISEAHQSISQETLFFLEASELRYEVIKDAMRAAGASIPDPLLQGFEEACKDLERAASFYVPELSKSDTHFCSSRTADLQELNRHDRISMSDRWREVADKESMERLKVLEASASKACRYKFFEKDEDFTSGIDGQVYKASGDVFVCINSCKVHQCTSETCKEVSALPHNEGYVCIITNRFYPPGFVHSNETTTRRFRDTKDGSLPTQGNSMSADTWRPTRTAEMRRNFRQRGKISKSRSENSLNTRRAESDDSHLYYVRREDFDGTPDLGAAIKIFEHSKSASPQSTITLLEFEMRKRHSQISPPVFTTTLRDQVNEYCKVMYYVAVAFVRKRYWRKVAEAEARINTSMATYYRAREARNLRADPLYVAGKIIEETKPLIERLIEIGFFDPESYNKALLLYLEEAVLAVWLLIQYTPWARRFYMGISLLNNVVGILYKLQSGVYIIADDGEPVYVIPRHPVLDKLPHKSDLNSFHNATSSCVGSDDSISTEKLIDDCFMSLPKDRETLEAFSLGGYISLWDEPVDATFLSADLMNDGD